MSRFQNLMFPLKSSDQGHSEQASQDFDEAATLRLANRVNQKLFHQPLPQDQREAAGEWVHYAFGTLVGGLFGAATEILPLLARGHGLAFATAVWGLGDEVAVPALGLAKPPRQYPARQHFYGFAAHAVYGLSLDFFRRAARTAVN